jgi:hypothetical protein
MRMRRGCSDPLEGMLHLLRCIYCDASVVARLLHQHLLACASYGRHTLYCVEYTRSRHAIMATTLTGHLYVFSMLRAPQDTWQALSDEQASFVIASIQGLET